MESKPTVAREFAPLLAGNMEALRPARAGGGAATGRAYASEGPDEDMGVGLFSAMMTVHVVGLRERVMYEIES